MSTARDLCTGALEDIGALGVGEIPSADDINKAFRYLNAMVDGWSIDQYMSYNQLDEQFATTGSMAAYNIGPGATWNTVRPASIISAFVRYNSVDYPLNLINGEDYNNIGIKTLASTLPTSLYYNDTFPNGIVNLWPVPSGALTISISSWKQFATFATLDTVLTLPPGYLRAIQWNLPIEICDAWGKQPTASMIKKAGDSKADVKRLNSPNLSMKYDSTLMGNGRPYSIYRDQAR